MKKITDKELSERIKVHTNTLSNWQKDPKRQELYRLVHFAVDCEEKIRLLEEKTGLLEKLLEIEKRNNGNSNGNG